MFSYKDELNQLFIHEGIAIPTDAQEATWT